MKSQVYPGLANTYLEEINGDEEFESYGLLGVLGVLGVLTEEGTVFIYLGDIVEGTWIL